MAKTKKAQSKKTARRRTGPVKVRSKNFARKDEEGPLGWLSQELEAAYLHLALRQPEGATARAVSDDATVIESRLRPEATTVVAPVTKTVWRDLLSEYKRRKSARARALAAAPAPAIPGGRNWLPLGPTVVLNGQTVGQQPIAGRIVGLVVAPGGQVIYAASANGGVFRSDDGATSWKALMDGFDLNPQNFASASVVCGAVAIDLADPQRVYAGTGEGDTDLMFRLNMRITNALPAYRGIGPIRSDDGGRTWVSEDSNPDLAGESFFALAVDPTNRDNVVAATTIGLYRRVPAAGGKFKWNRVKQGTFPAVVVAAAGGTVRFVATEWSGGVFHSTDGGQSWSALGTGFPTTNVSRTALGVQTDNPNVIYALAAATSGGLLGLFRCQLPGGAWKSVTGVPNILYGQQGDYDLAVAVAPDNPNIVYVAGDRTNAYPFSGNIRRCVIAASGGGFQVQSTAPIGTHAHADVHVLTHTPGDADELWCATDGGVFINRDPKGTGEFAGQNSGLSCLCTNFLAQHPTDPNILFAGLQDNGTARTTSGPIWTHVQDGDGGYCIVNWKKPSNVLVYMGGGVFRSTNGGNTFDDNPVWDFGGGTMTLPMVTPDYHPSKPSEANIVAVGAGQDVYVSKNFAGSWPDNMRISLPAGSESAFALAFASPTRLFIGTTNGRVFRADRPGNAWTLTRLDNVAAGPLGLQGLITDIVVDLADANRASVYVVFGGQGGDHRRVWRFDGTRWEARSGPGGAQSLLNVEHNALVIDPADAANLYAGADIGVWHSPDGGLTWEPLENGLPDTPVYDLQIHPTRRLIRAATHGRGLYELPLP